MQIMQDLKKKNNYIPYLLISKKIKQNNVKAFLNLLSKDVSNSMPEY